MVSSDWPCRSAQYGLSVIDSEMRSGFERARTGEPSGADHLDVQIARRPPRRDLRPPTENSAGREPHGFRQPADRDVRAQARLVVAPVAGVAPPVLALSGRDGSVRRSARSVGRIAFHRAGGPGTIAISRLHRKLDIAVGGERVDQHPELERRLAERLQPHCPAHPCRGSPKRTTIRSPSRRNPRTTWM